MNTKLRSPKLHGIIERNFSGDDSKLLHRCFAISMENGGEIEWDFAREDGVSYNPKPARALIIAISDAKFNDPLGLGAIMLASNGLNALPCQEDHELPTEVFELAKEIALTFETPKCAATKTTRLLSSCLWLDRARQFHRAKDEVIRERRAEILKQVEEVLENGPEDCPIVKKLFHWLELFRRRKIGQENPPVVATS